ncbi:outer membrane protein assembly factor BamB family protein [Streptomyces cellostaticus]|uniref:outer membrane protein assembly factor BamB family protein n=1 Tax=Streptomyces cellostaticus TaxID=67285 RepID=UPI002026DB41|nr:PQQ-binding-like beta-propeller repeat protein [Streptomyces cellostaticus]
MTRRRLLTGLSGAGLVVAAGGGTTAWWLGTRNGTASRSTKTSDPFDIPPPARTPVERLDHRLDSDEPAGDHPANIWSLSDVADIYSPGLLPVRDVLVFGAASGGIAGHDVTNGKRRWSAPDILVKSGYLSLSDRLVVCADTQGALRTFVPSTGVAKWTCAEAEAATMLAADAEAVYVLTTGGEVRSVGRSDAKVRWTATVPADFRENLINPAVVGQGRLVLAASNGSVLAVRTGDGRAAWSRTADLDEHDIKVRPAISGDTAYVNGRTLEARRLSDGNTIWSIKCTGAGARDGWGSPAVDAEAVYAGDGNHPTRLDKRDGSRMWTPEQTGYAGESMTSLDKSRILVAAHAVWAFDSTGMNANPTELIAAKVADGQQVWGYPLPDFDTVRLAAAGNRVFVMYDSELEALTTF